MTTGRKAATEALKLPLTAAGWHPRAAGWLTKTVTPGVDAVLAVTAATRHHDPGTATVTVVTGLRVEDIENFVADAAGAVTPAYQQRTWVSPLGYLLPGDTYSSGELLFHAHNATSQAHDLAALITDHAEPELQRLAQDPGRLAALAETSISSNGPHGLARIAALRARHAGAEAGVQYAEERVEALSARTDTAADLERVTAARVRDSLNEAR